MIDKSLLLLQQPKACLGIVFMANENKMDLKKLAKAFS